MATQPSFAWQSKAMVKSARLSSVERVGSSPDERSDIRVACIPAYRSAHAGYHGIGVVLIQENRMLGRKKLTVAMLLLVSTITAVPRAAPVLDYDFFKARVEPIFLEKRAGHVRCYVCHAESNNAFRLQRLSPGAATWNEEQSRRNFEAVSRLVNPGDPATSRLLQQPLAPEAGGNAFHSGGRQFESKDDPSFQILADWINGKKP